MAYNAVAQIDHEVASNSSASVSRSPSPPNGNAFKQLPLDTDHIGAGSHLETAKTTDTTFDLGSMIRSMTSTSYDMVEDDDYEADPSSERLNSLRRIPPLNTTVARQHSSPEPLLHSACSDVPIPLSHPIPDLQSLQGAYIGNIERLEESAEKLTSCSADIGTEIRRLDQESKQRSSSSASNSFILRNDALSPTGTISSAHESNLSPVRLRSASGSHLARVSEPGNDEQYGKDESSGLPISAPPLLTPKEDHYAGQNDPQVIPVEGELERRASVASVDTYQQTRTLFTDFDGVHFTPLEHESGRQPALNRQPPKRNQESNKGPQLENVVYYPAPVPRMLNLPPKLSRKTNADRDKRRTQLMGAIAAEDRKSTVLVKGAEQQSPRSSHSDKRKSTVPPHLRASVFFEQPSFSLPVEMKQDSAVATLESILDASANAPVSAFTDHPYAGNIGSKSYSSNRKTSSNDPAGQKANPRLSQATLGQSYGSNNGVDDEDTDTARHLLEARGLNDTRHEHGHDIGSGSESDAQSLGDHEEKDEELDYVSPPNTLLAELELRKHELKHRRRTAMPMHFDGTQTTLMQIDEKAQQQSDKRRLRPISLAWEHHEDDEDVPLAMLYPNKTSAQPEDRPLGLIEKRQQEENEPLSSRRARLRGEPIPQPVSRLSTIVPRSTSNLADESVDESESLADRLQRLKGHNRSESKFASDLMAEIDTRAGIAPRETQMTPEANEEETLAQRRSRLQKEAANPPGPPKPRVRRSMAALTQGRPSYVVRQSSYDVLHQRPVTMSQYGNRMSMQNFPPSMGYPMAAGYPMGQQYGHSLRRPPSYSNPAMMGMTGNSTHMNRPPVAQLEPDVIDRWRQSIR